MDNKGQISVEGIFYALIAIIAIYAALLPFQEITSTGLFPLLMNMTYGTQTILLIEIIPIILVILVIVGLWKGSKQSPDYRYIE